LYTERVIEAIGSLILL